MTNIIYTLTINNEDRHRYVIQLYKKVKNSRVVINQSVTSPSYMVASVFKVVTGSLHIVVHQMSLMAWMVVMMLMIGLVINWLAVSVTMVRTDSYVCSWNSHFCLYTILIIIFSLMIYSFRLPVIKTEASSSKVNEKKTFFIMITLFY